MSTHLNPHMLPRGPLVGGLVCSWPGCAGRWSSGQPSGPCLPSSDSGTALAMGGALTSPELAQIRAIFQSPAEPVKHLGHSPLLVPEGPQGELCRNPPSQARLLCWTSDPGPPGSLGGSPSALHLGGLPPSGAPWAGGSPSAAFATCHMWAGPFPVTPPPQCPRRQPRGWNIRPRFQSCHFYLPECSMV